MTLTKDISDKKDNFEFNKEFISVFNKKIKDNDTEFLDKTLKDDSFLVAKDFFRKKKDLIGEKIYHHLGLYIFTKDALTRYVKLKRSKLEVERNLEQMRAMENNLIIKVGLSDSIPLGVDIEEDLKKVSDEMRQV